MAVENIARCRSKLRLISALCAAVGIAVYLSTLDCGFCYDDKSAILENRDVTGESSSSWQLLWNDFWGHPIHLNTSHKSYRPLCVATFRLNYLLHELQPMGYHLVNVLLHGAVCYLYVQLCGVIFSGAVWPALIAGLLFAVHPIHTEAVAGLVGRADLLAAIFFLLSFLSYHKGIIDAAPTMSVPCDSDTASLPPPATFAPAPGHGHLIRCLVFMLCSVASKELGITVVGLCLTYDLFLVNKVSLKDIWNFFASHPQKGTSPFSKPFLSRAVPLVLFSVVILIGRLWLMKSAPVFTKYNNEALVLDFPYRQLQWCYLIFYNSYLLLQPSLLLHDYRMGAVPLITSLLDHRILLIVVTVAVYAGLLFCAFRFSNKGSRFPQLQRYSANHMTGDVIINSVAAAVKKVKNTNVNSKELKSELSIFQTFGGNRHTSKEVLLFGLSLMIFPFLPASNLFFPVGFVVAERVLYLPSMGFCMLVAYGAHRLTQSKARWLSTAAKFCIVLLLASHSLKTLYRNRDWYSKGTLFKSLVKHYPRNGYILGNLALDFSRSGDEAMAEKLNRYAMVVAPDVPLSYVNLGSLLKRQGRLEEAEQVWRRAASVLEREEEPKTDKIAQVYTSLCGMVSAAGHTPHRLREALELCDRAVSTRSDLPDVHNMRGAVLTKMGRHKEAQLAFERALRRDPQNVNTMFNLALAYQNLGDVAVAMEILQWVLAIDHTHQLAKDQLRKLGSAH